MLRASDFRKIARDKCKGEWGTAIITYLLMGVLVGVSAAVFIGPILLTGPLTLGFTIVIMKIMRGEKAQITDLFEGFNDFVRAFLLWFTNTILVALWSILFVIPGIIKQFAYSMSFYILRDNPELDFNEARKQSIAMMRGNKWRLFCLNFSFIGWYILSVFTFGLLMFWVAPYMEAAKFAFYESIKPAAAAAESAPAELPEAAPETSAE